MTDVSVHVFPSSCSIGGRLNYSLSPFFLSFSSSSSLSSSFSSSKVLENTQNHGWLDTLEAVCWVCGEKPVFHQSPMSLAQD